LWLSLFGNLHEGEECFVAGGFTDGAGFADFLAVLYGLLVGFDSFGLSLRDHRDISALTIIG
jgi:hypothetical protein